MFHESINPNDYMKITDDKEQERKPDLLAFPLASIVPPHGLQTQPSFYLQSGMSLRDFFASQAMPYITLAYLQEIDYGIELDRDAVARESYLIADAMIKARGL